MGGESELERVIISIKSQKRATYHREYGYRVRAGWTTLYRCEPSVLTSREKLHALGGNIRVLSALFGQ